MKILEKKNVQINFTESLLRMAADDVEGEPPPSRTGVGVYRSCSALVNTQGRRLGDYRVKMYGHVSAPVTG